MSFPGFAIGVQQEEQARARKQELADEKRKVLLKTLQEDAETPADKVAAINAVYHEDPSVLRQHVDNLTRRLTGKGAQPVVSPADAQAGRLAPLAARGKTPTAQQEEQYGRELGMQQDAQLSGTKKLIEYRNSLSPEEQKNFDAVMGIASHGTIKGIPGSAGQPYKNANGQWVRAVENPNGTTAEQAMPAGWTPKPALPQLKQIKGHDVLYDPTTQKIVKDFGPHGSARVTNRQSIQYDADGNPHIVNLTSVSSPEGGQIEVDASQAGEGEPSPPPTKSPAPRKPAGSASPKPNPQLNFHKATPAATDAKKAVDKAQAAYLDVQKASTDPTPVGDQGIILAWLRGRVNRVTNTEIQAVNNLGGATMKLEGNIVRIISGKMTNQQRAWFLRSAKDNYDNAQTVYSKYQNPAPKGDGGVIVVSPEEMK